MSELTLEYDWVGIYQYNIALSLLIQVLFSNNVDKHFQVVVTRTFGCLKNINLFIIR